MKKVPVGYQLYSAREDVEKDMEGTFRALKDLGYEGVEFAGFFGKTAEEVKGILDRTGLIPVSSHVPYAEIKADMFGVISYHQKIGCKYIAVPYLLEEDRPGKPGFADVIRAIYQFGALCHAAGITLLYHNHDFEFTKISGMYGLDFLYQAVSADILKTELDVCWVKYSGEDPAQYLKKYAGRAPIVHLKDFAGQKGDGTPYGLIGQKEGATATQFEFRPVGYGCQDMRGIVEAGIEAGAGWFIVEQDQWYDRTALEAAKMSIGTLQKMGLQG